MLPLIQKFVSPFAEHIFLILIDAFERTFNSLNNARTQIRMKMFEDKNFQAGAEEV